MDDLSFNKEASIVAKGLAIIMMVVFHLFAFPDRNADLINFQGMGHRLFSAMQLCIPVYVFIAGYAGQLMFLKTDGTVFNLTLNSIRRLYLKFWTVAIPLLVISAIFCFPSIPSYGSSCNISNDISNIAVGGGKMLIFNIVGLDSTYCGEWWFLSMYIELALCSIILPRFKSISVMLGIWIMMITVGYLFRIYFEESTSIMMRHLLQLSKFVSVYFLGIIFCKFNLFEKIAKSQGFTLVISKNTVIPFLMIAVCILVRAYSPMKMIVDNIVTPIIILACIIIAYRQSLIRQVLFFMGMLSTELWLVHAFFIYYGFHKLVFFQHDPLITLLLVVIYSIILAIVFKWIEKMLWQRKFSKIHKNDMIAT